MSANTSVLNSKASSLHKAPSVLTSSEHTSNTRRLVWMAITDIRKKFLSDRMPQTWQEFDYLQHCSQSDQDPSIFPPMPYWYITLANHAPVFPSAEEYQRQTRWCREMLDFPRPNTPLGPRSLSQDQAFFLSSNLQAMFMADPAACSLNIDYLENCSKALEGCKASAAFQQDCKHLGPIMVMVTEYDFKKHQEWITGMAEENILKRLTDGKGKMVSTDGETDHTGMSSLEE